MMFVRGVVARCTARTQARAGSDKPWRSDRFVEGVIEEMLRAIVGIEIEITRMVRQVEARSESEAAGSHQLLRRVAKAR